MNINPEIKNHLVKISITSIFVAAVWFVSFAIFPENQVVKLDIGDPSPKTFIAPKYIEVEDTESTELKKEIAEKLLTTQQRPWITIPDAMKKIDDLRADENTDKKFLNDYDLFVQDLEAYHRKNL